jgi:tetratricopeptide (TPR) repeat protein
LWNASAVNRAWNSSAVYTTKKNEMNLMKNFLHYIAGHLDENLYASQRNNLFSICACPIPISTNHVVNLLEVKTSFDDLTLKIMNELKTLNKNDLEIIDLLSIPQSKPSFLQDIFESTYLYRKIDAACLEMCPEIKAMTVELLTANFVELGHVKKAVHFIQNELRKRLALDKSLQDLLAVLLQLADIHKIDHSDQTASSLKGQIDADSQNLFAQCLDLVKNGAVNNAIEMGNQLSHAKLKSYLLKAVSLCLLQQGLLEEAIEIGKAIQHKDVSYFILELISIEFYKRGDIKRAIELEFKLNKNRPPAFEPAVDLLVAMLRAGTDASIIINTLEFRDTYYKTQLLDKIACKLCLQKESTKMLAVVDQNHNELHKNLALMGISTGLLVEGHAVWAREAANKIPDVLGKFLLGEKFTLISPQTTCEIFNFFDKQLTAKNRRLTLGSFCVELLKRGYDTKNVLKFTKKMTRQW